MKILLQGIAFFLSFGTYHFAGQPGKQCHYLLVEKIEDYKNEFNIPMIYSSKKGSPMV